MKYKLQLLFFFIISYTSLAQTPSGQPQNLSKCIENQGDLTCFDLTVNNPVILNGSNPSSYNISYHLTQDDATNDLNPLSLSYCVAGGVYTLFSRVENLSDQMIEIRVFTVTSKTYINVGSILPISQCDDNNDGFVIYDLTAVQSQLSTLNQLSFYTSQVNAQNQTNAIANFTAYSVNANFANSTIYIRENIPNDCDNIYTINLASKPNCNTTFSCANAIPLCAGVITYPNSTNSPNGGQLGCLGSTPNATWFSIPIGNPGTIYMQINQGNNSPTYNNIDIDYVIYGPFSSSTGNCGSINNMNPVSCSYSSNATEYPTIPNALSGHYYLMMVTNYANQPGIINIAVLPTSIGTVDCDTGMTFTAFLDSNSNGAKDNGEINFPLGDFHYEKNNDGVVHNITSPTGRFAIFDSNTSNSYDVGFTVNPLYTSLYSVNPSAFNDLSNANGTSYNFPVTSTQNYSDLGALVVAVNNPRPGFNYINKLVYWNSGNQVIANGTVTFTKDGAVSISAVSQAGVVNNASGFTYDFTNLQPFEYRSIDIFMLVPTIPTVTAGQFLVSSATISPLVGDAVPENNTHSTSQMIINAYDPNDKMEAHGPEILHSSFTSNDYLYYTIRFENTGNAKAINVRVNDVLNAMLDENSIKVESASHAYVLDRVGSNLTWKFDNIMLPVSIANSAVGKGFITFKVKPKPGYAVGDIIPNSASIYFDFNPAIVTNTFQTEFVAVLESETFLTDEFAVYPNPTSSILNVQSKLNTAISEINVYDLLGKQILNKKMNVSATEIDFSNYSPGLYLLEVVSENNQKSIHKIIKK
ncbi:MAG: T9SS type A sorting domain-containing protein [Bacteroidota bacterium]